MSAHSILALSAFVALAGCAQPPEPATAAQLRSRAAFELSCPSEQLALVRIDETTGGVAGCGRRVVYVEACDERGRCSWKFERDAEPGAPPRASPYPGDLPPRGSPYVSERTFERSEADSEWRARVPRLLRDDPGF